MERIARVALSAATYSIDRPYDYLIPPELEKKLNPGMRVIIPFGAGNRRTEGMILSIAAQAHTDKKLKAVLAQLDDVPVLDEDGIRLALWMREHCFCTVYDAVRVMLPAGLYFSLRNRYRLAAGLDREAAYQAAGRSEHAKKIIELVLSCQAGVDLREIREVFGTRDPNPALKNLTDRGVLIVESSVERGIGDKFEQVAALVLPPEEAMALVASKRRTAPMRYAVTKLLCALGSASAKELCYFTGASYATLHSLERSGVLALERREVLRRPEIGEVEPAGPICLNQEQDAAFRGLDALCADGKPSAALLYGVTGSGKTQVYLRLIQEVLKRGKTAMVLVPEISLTPQFLRIFTAHFGKDIAILHSSLRAGERYDEWKRIRDGQANVVIGTRSAVFAPLKHLGLLVLDEEQEYTYKSEQIPKYHARDVAKYRCVQNSALLLLGSATPSIESMYRARAGIYQLFTLSKRYNERELPQVFVADRKEDLRAGSDSSLSQPLRQAIMENLDRKEQSILFLNRRGANRMVTCASCGTVPTCPNCSVYLTYHSANGRLMCHYCGYSERLPSRCPSCGGALSFIGTGTQRVQEEVQECFPGIEVLRMDTDTISATQSHEKLLSRFEREKIPILVGTQMVAKGLNFENVTLVGVVSADQSLYIDDYRAGERTFSLITQVVGRAGRGNKRGRAIIQTYTPENDVISCAARQDYDSFYEQEIELRRLRGCPPFRDLFLLTASGPEEGSVIRACMRMRRTLESWIIPFRTLTPQILGPAPASVAKVNNRYRYRLTLSCQNVRTVREMIACLLRCAQQDRENRGVFLSADINPVD